MLQLPVRLLRLAGVRVERHAQSEHDEDEARSERGGELCLFFVFRGGGRGFGWFGGCLQRCLQLFCCSCGSWIRSERGGLGLRRRRVPCVPISPRRFRISGKSAINVQFLLLTSFLYACLQSGTLYKSTKFQLFGGHY